MKNKNAKPPKFKIMQNAWGNWYGYQGTKKVKEFANMPDSSQEDAAKIWLKQMSLQ